MKYLVAIVFIALATGISAQDDECIQEKTEECIDNLLVALIGDATDDEVCGELKTSIDCLQAAVSECVGQDANADDVLDGINELEKVLKENCEEAREAGEAAEEPDTAEGVAKCLEENDEYVYECISDETAEAIQLMKEEDPEDGDENTFKCGMYALMAACMVERVEEKCGAAAALSLEEELSDPPEEIKEACNASESVVIHAFELLAEDNDKRKKK